MEAPAITITKEMKEVLIDFLKTRDSDTDALRHGTLCLIRDLQRVIYALVDEGGAEIHEEDCPMDDTCDCEFAKVVNEALDGMNSQ